MEFGHTVHFIDASTFTDEEFVKTINNINFDYYISTNELNKVQHYSTEKRLFLFELINGKIIYIHQDNLFSCINDIQTINSKANALSRTGFRSFHFGIEKRNIDYLKSINIQNSFKINYATEFELPVRHKDFKYGVSFVGHLMTTTKLYPIESLNYGTLAMGAVWNKVNKSNFNIENYFYDHLQVNPILKRLVDPEVNYPDDIYFYHFIANLNKLSSAYRGDILKLLIDKRIEIIGGDLSYGKIDNPLIKFDQSNIFYHPATLDYNSTMSIYNESQINLNISSLQFDYALNPRIFDSFASGGFLLTDRMPELSDLFENSDLISFNTADELNFKISYYADKSNSNKRNEITSYMNQQILTKYNYAVLVNQILSLIQ